jgi:LacI family transcriptional regulator
MITIMDVAEKAGVSASTVSQVLNGNRPTSQKAREIVLQVIEELGYIPNPNARALKSEKKGAIGFLAGNITEPYWGHIIHGVEKVSRKEKCSVTFAAGSRFNYDIHAAISYLHYRRVDGIIISTEFTGEEPLEKELPTDIPIVSIDNYQGGRTAAEHLLEQGCRKPNIILGPPDSFMSEERKRGFIDRVSESGITIPKPLIPGGDFTPQTGEQRIKQLMEQDAETDGVFCTDDFIAAGALNQLERLGIRVPGDVRIIGYGNRDFSSFWPTPITSFAQPLDEMGRLGARFLFELINGERENGGILRIEARLIPRKSG